MAAIRKKKKATRKGNERKKAENKAYKRIRKKQQRERTKQEERKVDGRTGPNQRNGRARRTEQQVQKYLLRDNVSMITPDLKKFKKGIRYRLESLKKLHQRFQVDKSVDCYYVQFTRYVPRNVIKPKPEDWGTCPCMTCPSPKLKLESIKKQLPGIAYTGNDFQQG